MTHSSIAVVVAIRSGWPLRHPSPKNWPGSKIPTTASLPCSDRTVSLTLPFERKKPHPPRRLARRRADFSQISRLFCPPRPWRGPSWLWLALAPIRKCGTEAMSPPRAVAAPSHNVFGSCTRRLSDKPGGRYSAFAVFGGNPWSGTRQPAPADSDDLARVYRFDLARGSEMISPTIPI